MLLKYGEEASETPDDRNGNFYADAKASTRQKTFQLCLQIIFEKLGRKIRTSVQEKQ